MLISFALGLLLQQAPFLDEVTLDQDESSRREDPLRQALQEQPLVPIDEFSTVTSWSSEWFPAAAIYRNYLADPLTPRSGTKVQVPIRKKDHTKLEGSVGSQRTIWRSVNRDGTEGVDVGVEGAIFTRFDLNEGWDVDSGDYRWGFPMGYRRGNMTAKFHVVHISSHIGDEFMSRTNNINAAKRYHNDMLSVGFAYEWTPEIRAYVDGAWSFYTGTYPEGSWRAETGVEWAGNVFWSGPPYTYVAVDVKWRQETDWDTAVAIQTGLWLAQAGANASSNMRVLLEYYQGRSAQTQFPEEREAHWALGFAAGF